jgi:uncharacterized membrane protein YtjA (UPF0391 family)
MLNYAILFLVIALVAGFLGFGGMAAGAAVTAKVLFGIFFMAAMVILALSRRRRV